MKRFALIGSPVCGSLSPRLFAAAYQGKYQYDLIDAPFSDCWARFLASYDGINVTAPYKQDAFKAVDRLSPAAAACGAVNLVVKADGMLHGYNTDVDGVTGAVQECGQAVSDALIIGAGGAARAAAYAALQLGCSVTVANRTHSKAEALAQDLGCNAVPVTDICKLTPDLIIYTVPGGQPVLSGLTGTLLSNAVVLEAEYKHPALMDVPCRHYIHGSRWLLWQAIAGYRLFTGETPDAAAMAEIL